MGDGIYMQCHKCGYIWEYRGNSDYRTSCPACHITVYLDKCKISDKDFHEFRLKEVRDELETLESMGTLL